MGYIIEPTPEMGEYHVEVRRESFYLGGSDNFVWVHPVTEAIWDGNESPGDGWECKYRRRRHGIVLYRCCDDINQGTVEILLEDIPKIRACLDAVEQHIGATPTNAARSRGAAGDGGAGER